jgi:hypothetical protein
VVALEELADESAGANVNPKPIVVASGEDEKFKASVKAALDAIDAQDKKKGKE